MPRRFTLYGEQYWTEEDKYRTSSPSRFDPELQDNEVIAVVEELPVQILIDALTMIAIGKCRDYAEDAKKALEEYNETA